MKNLYNNLSKRNKALVLVIGILLVLTVIIGISYAFYSFTIGQEGSNQLGSECFKLTFEDKNNISLLDTIPLSEEEASSLTPYEFTKKISVIKQQNMM